MTKRALEDRTLSGKSATAFAEDAKQSELVHTAPIHSPIIHQG